MYKSSTDIFLIIFYLRHFYLSKENIQKVLWNGWIEIFKSYNNTHEARLNWTHAFQLTITQILLRSIQYDAFLNIKISGYQFFQKKLRSQRLTWNGPPSQPTAHTVTSRKCNHPSYNHFEYGTIFIIINTHIVNRKFKYLFTNSRTELCIYWNTQWHAHTRCRILKRKDFSRVSSF